MNSLPQPRRIVLRESHDSLCGTVAYKISLLDTVDEGIVHDHALCIKANELLVRPVAEMHNKSPGKGTSF